MSWFSENYDKAAIGLGVFGVLGVGAMIFLGSGKVEEEFALDGGKPGKADSTPNDWKVKAVLNSLSNPLAYTQKKFGNRPVNLFVGVPTFVEESDKTAVVDLPKAKDVHDGIPNTWWLEHKIDPGFSNSPERDADEDGFSNREEYEAKTDPNNSSDCPALIHKLVLKSVDESDWLIRHGGIVSGKTRLSVRTNTERDNGDYFAPGTIFPKKTKYADSFKFIENQQKSEMNERTNIASIVDIAIVEDQRPHMDKRRYEVRSKRHPANREIKRHYLGTDRTAVLVLDAVGEGSKEFKIDEGKMFSLPAGQAEKPYRITKIAPDKTVTVTGPGLDSPLTLKP